MLTPFFVPNTKMTSYDDVNPGPDLGQAKESLGGGGGNGIPILPSWIGCLISSTICTDFYH
jgi:hypothetical protein